jgi:hypothetical protein
VPTILENIFEGKVYDVIKNSDEFRLLEENPEITELINNKEQVMNFILSNPGELPFDLEMRSPIDICLAQQNMELAKLDNYIC